MDINNKNIILCITGGIAAYKAVYLASFFKKKGANVYAVLTENATKFITTLTLKSITGNKVTTKMFDDSDFIPHISLSDMADLVIVAPATANIISKAATGLADDMISTLLVSATAPKIIIPSMNTNMYNNSITQVNIQILKDNGYYVIEPDDGDLACGTKGAGRFPEIEAIYGFINKNIVDADNYYFNKKIIVTLGGTVEDIDPVRYISNRSSGRMGLELSERLIEKGADVKIICGNVSDLLLKEFTNKYKTIEIIRIRSVKDMKNELVKRENSFDILFMAAALADYSPDYSVQKIKKSEDDLMLQLCRTEDVLMSLNKRENAVYIGFAAESENLIENAREKMDRKGLDFVVSNIISGEKSAIGKEKAEVILLNKWDDEEYKIEYSEKEIVSNKIIEKIEKIIEQYN